MKKMLLRAVSVLSVLAMAPTVQAEEALETFTLDEIVVVADRLGNEVDQESTSISVKELIDAGQIKTAADILANVPGVVVKRGQNSGIQVGLRGLNHERVVIAINGNIVQNVGEIARGRALEWDALPVTGIKKIELIRGASALYGGAVGGVINIITDDSAARSSRTTLRQSFGSWGTDKTTVIHQGASDDQRWSWNINASRSKSDGYYRNNESNAHDIHFDTTYKLNDEDRLNFSYSHVYKREGIIIGNNTNGSPASRYLGYDSSYPMVPNAPQNWVDGYRQWKTDNFALNYTTPVTSIGLYDYRQYRHDYIDRVVMRKGKPTPLGMRKYWDSNIRNYGLNWRQTTRLEDHTLQYGLQLSQMNYDLDLDGRHYELPSIGAFLQDDWALTKDTTLRLALRYDRNEYEANSGGVREKKNTQLSPSLKITHRLNDQHTIYAGASRVFRSPTVADYSRWSTGYADRDNDYKNDFAPGLSQAQWEALLGVPSPEKGMSYEIGWRGNFGDKTTLGLTGFYYDLDDFLNISFGKGNLRPPLIYNINKVKVKGLEFVGQHRFDRHWGISAGYTRQSTSKSGDRFSSPLKGMPESTFNVGLRWDSRHGMQAALDLRYFGAVPFSSDEMYISPRAIADLTVSYAFENHVINLAVNNLFDRYYEESRGYRQPGINYNISYQYTF